PLLFFHDTASTSISTLSLHDALPISLWQATTVLREHRGDGHNAVLIGRQISPVQAHLLKSGSGESVEETLRVGRVWPEEVWAAQDRKSTRLNSSHVKISYAVFCLKKK